MAFDTFDTGTLDVFSSITGSAIDIPKGFWKPGTASLYNAYAGKTSLLNYGQGSLNVGMSPDSPFAYTGAPGNVNFHNTSITTYTGDHRVLGRSSVAGTEFRANVANVHLVGVNAQLVGSYTGVHGKSVSIGGAAIDISATNVSINGLNSASGARPAFWDSKKPFDILHPTKEGHRLRYVCLEGPSAEVYFRGKLKGSNIIKIPDYWKGLVDEETIGINLTPIRTYQELFVEKIDIDSGIKIKNNSGNTIYCHYVVYGERKDTSKNIPEYPGLTPDDYPGDNREYRLNS